MPNDADDQTRGGQRPTTFLSKTLVATYQRAEYRVSAPQPFTLRIGEKSEDLWSAYRQFGVAAAAFITAWNPYSQDTTDALNATNQATLLRRIEALGFFCWDGLGINPSGDLPGEPSIFVLGIGHDDAVSLGVAFRQNAIVWAGDDAIPRLVLLR